MSRARAGHDASALLLAAAATLLLAITTTPAGAGAAGAGEGAAARPPSRPAAQQTPPNIVVIMVDDMRQDDLRYMPWTRKLVGGGGVRFVNSFSPTALCCPARASVLSGLTMHNHGVLDVDLPWGFHSFDDRSTLATWLRDAGYATVYLGKYLNGYGEMPEPGAQAGDSLHYVPPGWSDWRASFDGGFGPDDPSRGETHDYWDTTLSDDGRGFTPLEGQYQTRAYGAISEQVIRERARFERPFLLYASYTAPHAGKPREPDDPARIIRADGSTVSMRTPARPPGVHGLLDDVVTEAPGASWLDPDFTDKPGYLQAPPVTTEEAAALLELTRQRAESLWVVDRQVRRTVRALRRSGELDDTFVLFTSDNGYFLGEQRILQGKALPHEPSMRVPLLLRGPGIPHGERRRDPITSADIAPTLTALAGVSPGRRVDGATLAGVARHGDRGWRRGILTESRPMGGVDRGTDLAGGPLDVGEEVDARYVIGVRTERYLYLEIATGERELYDLAVDPRQYTNLAGVAGHRTVERKLREVLAGLRDCDGAECRERLPAALVGG